MIVYAIIRDFGAEAQAGFGVGARVIALSFAIAPVVGQNFGGRHVDRIRDSFYSAAGIALILMLLLTVIVQFAASALIRPFSRDPAVITFGSDYLKIISFNFVAVGLVFISSSVFQGIGNTLPPLLSSTTRLLLFALPATLLSQKPGFQIRYVWYLSVLSIFFQACVNLLLLQREFRRKLTFRETPDLTTAAGAALIG